MEARISQESLPPIGTFRSTRLLWVLLLLVLALAYWHASRVAFVQDDAFITFRYAKNWLEGHGLVFNVTGKPVEGYTNFLWLAICAIPMRFGVAPDVASRAIGLALFPFTLLASFGLFRRACGRMDFAVLGVFLLGLNYSFAAYATGGLETQLQCLLGVGLLLLSDQLRGGVTVPKTVGFGVVASLAILCRLDSALIVAVAFWHAFSGEDSATIRKRSIFAVGGTLLVLLALWTAWRIQYYGRPLPNTFYVKAGGLHVLDGLKFLATFAWAYFIGPFHLLLLGMLFTWDRSIPLTRLLLVTIVVWTGYVLMVGGDFMEFRMMVGMMPVFTALLLRGLTLPKIRIVGWLCLASQLANPIPNWKPHELKTNSSIPKLTHELEGPTGWTAIGKRLHAIFGPSSQVVIGVTAAGAIPYYSELQTVDMLGLNDREVADRGIRVKDRPGHQVKATVALLREKGVNLAFSHPQLMPLSDPTHIEKYAYYFKWHFRADPEFDAAYRGAKLIAIPLDGESAVIAWYLTPSQEVDAAITTGHWPVAMVGK